MAGRTITGAISVVLGGGTCLPSQTIASAAARGPSRLPRSRRESEILAHLARGASNKVIARELGLSVATVKLHVQAILRSTNARNRVEAIVNARKMGLLND
jgi:DNA-binding NarL/FixJ family response regulator